MRVDRLTSVTAHAAGSAGRSEEDNGISQDLDIALERRTLLVRELGF